MAWQDRTLAEVRRAKRCYGPGLLQRPHVVGLGIGWKIVRGERQPGRALRVYVLRKRTRADLSRAECFPSELPLPAIRGLGPAKDGSTVALDVIELGGEPEPCARPVVMGDACSRERSETFGPGTMGAVVEDENGQRYLLSNNHVLADVNHGQVDDPILEPPVSEGGRVPDDVIGELDRFVEIRQFETNLVDAALARLRPGVDQGTVVAEVGPVTEAISVPVEGTRVKLFGQASNRLLRGMVFDREFESTFINYRTMLARFDGLIMLRLRVREGDSGSLVLTHSGKAFGLLVSRRGGFAFACPLKPSLQLLGSSQSSTGSNDLQLRLV